MHTLVPLDTADPNLVPNNPNPQSYTLVLSMALYSDRATFDLTPFNFQQPPSNILPTLIKSDGSKSNIGVVPRLWTATTFTCDFTSLTDDTTYVCSIQIFP